MNTILKIDLTLAGKHIRFDMSVDATCPTDQEFLTAVRMATCPEPEVCHLMARALRPGDYAIDGGANIGFFTVMMSYLVGPHGFVMAVEPGSNNIFKLEDNLEINHCSNVEIIKAPLWNAHEKVQLYMCSDGGKNSLAPHAGTRGAAPFFGVKLNDYADVELVENIRLIKLDIEGAEAKALEGATSFLGKCPFIAMELNVEALPKFGSSVAGICDFLRPHGYEPFLLHPDGALPTYIPRLTKVIPSRLNWNVLFASFDVVSEAWSEIVA